MQLRSCHYSWCEAPSCGVKLLLSCGLRSGTCCPMVWTPENTQLPACTVPVFSLGMHFSLQAELVMVFPRFWAAPEGHSICLIPGGARVLCFATALQKYSLSTSLSSSQLLCWKRHFLYSVAQKCMMLDISFQWSFYFVLFLMEIKPSGSLSMFWY